MCGISGIYLKKGERVDPELLSTLALAMERRGPDAQGIFAKDNIGLVHRRLKIIDLSEAGAQPFYSDDRRIALVFNGEVYNFPELKEELLAKGHRFHSKTDTEVILHSFLEWGENSFSKFNGMFSFALWDELAGTLYLVRDRHGIKPFYYTIRDQRVAFASELKPLLKLPWVAKQIDPQTLFHFLKFSHVPYPDSILSDVKQVEPGTFLRIQEHGMEAVRYWSYSTFVPKNNELSEEDWLERIDQTFVNVMKRQMISDVPLGCFLSGGVDSSLIAHYCSQLSSRPIDTFTIRYDDPLDEGPYAELVSKAVGSRHFAQVVTAKDFFELIPEVPLYFDQPFADPTLLPSLLLAKSARKHVTVALSGDGGDELFFGYTYQRALLFFRHVLKMPAALRRPAFEAIRAMLKWIPSQRAQQLGKLSEVLQAQDSAELFEYFVGTIGPMRMDRVRALIRGPVSLKPPVFEKYVEEYKDLPWRDKIEQMFIRTFMVDTVLAKTDHSGMAYGLEGRVPFLDNELVRLSAELPFRYKLRRGTSKYLLRKLLERKIPGSISKRPKQGFSIPMASWLRGDLKYLLDEHLSPSRILKEGYFNPEPVSRVIAEHLGGRANHSHLLWSLISFQLWREKYLP